MSGIRPIDLELEPVENELRRAGLKISELGSQDISSQPNYDAAVQILLDHLARDYSDHARAVMASVLCAKHKSIKSSWRPLVDLYRSNQNHLRVEHKGESLVVDSEAKMMLANALLRAYDSSKLPELVELIADPSNGSTRLMLLSIVKRNRKKPDINEVIARLKADPVLAVEIASWK